MEDELPTRTGGCLCGTIRYECGGQPQFCRNATAGTASGSVNAIMDGALPGSDVVVIVRPRLILAENGMGWARGIPQLTTVVCLALAVFSAPVVDIDGSSIIRLGAGSYLLRMLRTAHSH